MTAKKNHPLSAPRDGVDSAEVRQLRAQFTNVSAETILLHVQELLRSLEILPRVDEEGGSDCPFAENLFAQKEQAAATLREDLSELLSIKQELVEEIGRLRENLDLVNFDAAKLRTPAALEGYGAATQELIMQAESVQRELDDILMLIEVVSAALKRSERMKFPGREPIYSPVSALGNGNTELTASRPNSPLVGGIISLGPMGSGGGTFGGWAK